MDSKSGHRIDTIDENEIAERVRGCNILPQVDETIVIHDVGPGARERGQGADSCNGFSIYVYHRGITGFRFGKCLRWQSEPEYPRSFLYR